MRAFASRAALFVLGAAPVLVATGLLVRHYPPTFRSTGLLMLDAGSANVAGVGAIYEPLPLGSTTAEYYRTEFELLRSRAVLEAAARAVAALDRPEFAAEVDPVAAFAETVTVQPIRDSRLVRISAESRCADFAARAAQAVMTAFSEQRAGSLRELTGGGLASLRKQEAELRRRHEDASRALRDFMEKHAMVSIDEQQSPAAQELSVLSAELARTRAERARAEARCAAFTQALAAELPGVVTELARTRVIEELTLSLSRAEEEKDRLSRSFGADHPQMKAVNARVESLAAKLGSERSAILQHAQRDLEVARAQEAELTKAVARAREAVSDFGRDALELQFLRREAELTEGAYKAVAKRADEVALSEATGARATSVAVVDRPTVSRRPVRPNRTIMLLFGALVATLVGFGTCRLYRAASPGTADADDTSPLEPDLVAGAIALPRGLPGLDPRRGRAQSATSISDAAAASDVSPRGRDR